MENKIESLDILAFGAHPDDVELSAAGTLVKMIAKNYTVGIVDLTEGELGSRGTVESRYTEAEAARQIMGVKVRHNLRLADGFFSSDIESKMAIIAAIRRYRPRIVLCNAVSDRHPDHSRAAQLVSEACFYSGLPKVKSSWENEVQGAHRPQAVYHYIQDRHIKPDFVVDISPYVEKKMQSITAYKTQFFNPEVEGPQTPISGEDFIDFLYGRMREFGRTIGTKYAEGFTVERTPGVSNLMDLL